jgi:hypothetical protein
VARSLDSQPASGLPHPVGGNRDHCDGDPIKHANAREVDDDIADLILVRVVEHLSHLRNLDKTPAARGFDDNSGAVFGGFARTHVSASEPPVPVFIVEACPLRSSAP